MFWNLSDAFDREGYREEKELTELEPIEVGGVMYPIKELTKASFLLTHKDTQTAEITGRLALKISIPCDRCLEEVTQSFDITFSYIVASPAYPGEDTEEYEYDFMDGYQLDLTLLIRDEILMDWPMKVLCSDSCKGICMKCGINLNNGSCACDTFVPDPRWAGLSKIFDNGN